MTTEATTGALASVTGRSRRTYDEELALLPATYAWAVSRDQDALARERGALTDRPAVFVGSGGAFAVAALGRDLHQRTTGNLAQAVTSLELLGAPPGPSVAVVLVSAGARHPDTAAAAAAALAAGSGPVVLLTERDPAALTGPLADPRLRVVSLPGPSGRDGFLATNSVLNLATALVRLYEPSLRLPRTLPRFARAGRRTPPGAALQPGGRVLLLTGPGLTSPGADLETRLSETGLAAVQLTDYRNFAHGRHYGLSQNTADTTVVALVSPALGPLADATLAALPPELPVVRLATALEGGPGVLDLLCATMQLVGASAAAAGLDPARPAVPAFGRRLYHMSSRRLYPTRTHGDVVARKETEAGVRSATPAVRRTFGAAFEAWSDAIADARFGAVVLDYDGTVCRTDDRYSLPERLLQARVVELLSAGLVVGFASGRGGSLPRDLRAWVPPEHWHVVHLALYNGGVRYRLDDPAAEDKVAGAILPQLRPVLSVLQRHPLARFLDVEARPAQITVTAAAGSGMTQGAVSDLVRQIVRTASLDGGRCEAKSGSSGHSEDIIPATVSKADLVRDLEALTGRDVLAIGDQGHSHGNDYELLALRTHTLSVDRSSADPTRCWNLSRDGRSGPPLLQQYLGSVRRSRSGFRFDWVG